MASPDLSASAASSSLLRQRIEPKSFSSTSPTQIASGTWSRICRRNNSPLKVRGPRPRILARVRNGFLPPLGADLPITALFLHLLVGIHRSLYLVPRPCVPTLSCFCQRDWLSVPFDWPPAELFCLLTGEFIHPVMGYFGRPFVIAY